MCYFIIRKRSSGKSDIAVSASMVYGEVKLEQRGGGGEVYKTPESQPGQCTGRGDYELTQCPAYESTAII